MKYYEVLYLNKNDNAVTLVDEVLKQMKIEEVEFTDLNYFEANNDNDIYIYAFDFLKNELPYLIMNSLMDLEKKQILFIITIPFIPNQQTYQMVKKRIEPFLPDACVYHGCFICAGKYAEEIVEKAKSTIHQYPNNEYAKYVLDQTEMIHNHPDKDDIVQAVEFLQKVI